MVSGVKVTKQFTLGHWVQGRAEPDVWDVVDHGFAFWDYETKYGRFEGLQIYDRFRVVPGSFGHDHATSVWWCSTGSPTQNYCVKQRGRF